jgi:hypothetical protein
MLDIKGRWLARLDTNREKTRMTDKKPDDAATIEALQAEIAMLKTALDEALGHDGTPFNLENAEAVKERVQEGLGDIQKQIDAHPVPSALLAFGLGFLLGRLLLK